MSSLANDRRFVEAQSSVNSYQHAMRSLQQSTGDAQRQFYDFINGKEARALAHAAKARDAWSQGKTTVAEKEIREEKKGVYEKGQELGRIKES